ncbi:MAG: polyprenyl synthetase family protein [Gemmatimonadota bacterium]
MRAVSEGFSLATFLAEERAHVDAALQGAVAELLPDLPEGLRGPVEAGVMAPGKRLRPIFCIAAFGACRGAPSSQEPLPAAAYPLAAALELIHAYSLMHDDLPCMDDAPLRRGRPAPHTLFGEAATTVAAAALIPAAARQAWRAATALGRPIETRREIVRILARAAGAGGMVGGQGLDLLGEGKRLSRPELDRLHGMKTGALLTASLRIGGVAAGAAPKELDALDRYGREIGLAFQVADDVLDATAGADVLGKEPSDQALEKSTYVSLLGVEDARREAAARVEVAGLALEEGGISSPALLAMARHVVDRDR